MFMSICWFWQHIELHVLEELKKMTPVKRLSIKLKVKRLKIRNWHINSLQSTLFL